MSGYARTWMDAFRADGEQLPLSRYLETSPIFKPFESASAMATVAGRTLKVVCTSTAWTRDALVEISTMFRRCAIPLTVSSVIYAIGFATILLGNVVYAIGVADRVPAGTYLGLLRELITWITMMIVAGIIGSSLAGDLAARKIREELDALDVLGVDKFGALIVPRVMAMTYAAVVLPLFTLIVTTTGCVLAGVPFLHEPVRTQLQAIYLTMNPYDLVAACLKHLVIGFFLGVVACQKGLAAKGGAEGVGRAVSETVVVSFFGIWLVNSLFNLSYLTLVPDAIGLKG